MISNKTIIRTPVEELFLREMVETDRNFLFLGEEYDAAFDDMVPDTENLIQGTSLFESHDYSAEMTEDEFNDTYFDYYGL